MTLEEALKKHDWFFDFSDDMTQYRRGSDQKKLIKRMVQLALLENHEESDLVDLFRQYAPKEISFNFFMEEK